MNLKGSFVIEAPKSEVWNVFMDAEKLGGCVPGVERIQVLDDTRYEAEMTVKVQFMTIRFEAVGELKEARDGERLTVEMTGKPLALAGMFRNRLDVFLKENGTESTVVEYDMNLQMTGRLASLGALLVRGTVSKSAEEFAENVKKQFVSRDRQV